MRKLTVGGIAVVILIIVLGAIIGTVTGFQFSTGEENVERSEVTPGGMMTTSIEQSERNTEVTVEMEALERELENQGDISPEDALVEQANLIDRHVDDTDVSLRIATRAYENGDISADLYLSNIVSLNAYAHTWEEYREEIQQNETEIGIDLSEGVFTTMTEPDAEKIVSEQADVVRDAYFDNRENTSVSVSQEDEKTKVTAEKENTYVKMVMSSERSVSTNTEITHSEALEVATDKLGEKWVVTATDADTNSGVYTFDFGVDDDNKTGEAVVEVDAETGEIHQLRLGVDEDKEKFEQEETPSLVPVLVDMEVDGSDYVSEVIVFEGGERVSDAEVSIDGEAMGTTGSDDGVEIRFSQTDEIVLTAETEGKDGETVVEISQIIGL